MRPPPKWTEFPKYPVTSGTILLAVLATLAWWGKYNVNFLFETGDVRRGQVWRLVTSTLPHVDIIHLVFNVYWTWIFGTLIEETYGHLRTLLIFLFLALVANGAQFALAGGGVGLSGVGYGLFGMLWVLSRRDRRFSAEIDNNTIWLFVGWFFICVYMSMHGSPIGNVAHAAGAIAGALLGATMSATAQRLPGAAACAVLLAASLAGATVLRPWLNMSSTRGADEAQLGYAALEADQNPQAVRWYLDATRMKPDNANYWYNLGVAYERLDRTAEAQHAFARAADLDPGSVDQQSPGK